MHGKLREACRECDTTELPAIFLTASVDGQRAMIAAAGTANSWPVNARALI